MKRDFFRACVILVLAVSFGCDNIMSSDKTNDIPTSVEALGEKSKFDPETNKIFITLLNESHPDNRIGYRFFERLPFVYGTVPENSAAETAEANALEKQYAKKPGVFVRTIDVSSKGWARQKWTYYIVPAADGFEMLWVVETEDEGLNEYYSAQQCFRMSGKTNEKWRHDIALTPAFSEYDLWKQQEDEGTARTSLSFVRRNNRWEALPAIRSHLACRTPLGVKMDTARSGGDLSKVADMFSYEPYANKSYEPSRFEADVDCGLATRSNRENTWVCGLYWQNTTHISNHHPADCLHAYVNLGPLAPHSKRTIRGKIYWTKASRDELFALWQKDFGN
jgi:hypothetical protein